ncbi:CsbD family protein [Candidimonas sp. SYP-B2681]|uniref:CsbD family protein n=1 Tax=Candidimonas sp. SYP-B2681 TaxID=2497686 RepID=UPI000F8605E8|nr:CsbD family protein [Candidimonas sp. SYP-B2681]RTZ41097.1 CsbD family protein [Candidimonas sp. SYP-B2681]
MDKDKAKGPGHEVKSDIREKAGIATDKKATRHEGKAEKSFGTAQHKEKDIDDDMLDMPKE